MNLCFSIKTYSTRTACGLLCQWPQFNCGKNVTNATDCEKKILIILSTRKISSTRFIVHVIQDFYCGLLCYREHVLKFIKLLLRTRFYIGPLQDICWKIVSILFLLLGNIEVILHISFDTSSHLPHLFNHGKIHSNKGDPF